MAESTAHSSSPAAAAAAAPAPPGTSSTTSGPTPALGVRQQGRIAILYCIVYPGQGHGELEETADQDPGDDSTGSYQARDTGRPGQEGQDSVLRPLHLHAAGLVSNPHR